MVTRKFLSLIVAVLLCPVLVWAGSRDFTASTNRVTVTQYAAINNLNTLTVSIWAKQSSTAGAGAERLMDKFVNGIVGASAFLWFIQSNTNRVHWGTAFFQTAQGRWDIPYTADTTTWHHHAVTYDHGADTNNPLMYLDGASGTVNESITPSGNVLSSAETLDLAIGNRPAGDRPHLGKLAHAAVWNVILTPTQIAQLAACTHMPDDIALANLVAYLPIDANQSPEPNVASPANTGTVTGTTFSTDDPCPAAAGHPTMRRWGGIPGMGQQNLNGRGGF